MQTLSNSPCLACPLLALKTCGKRTLRFRFTADGTLVPSLELTFLSRVTQVKVKVEAGVKVRVARRLTRPAS